MRSEIQRIFLKNVGVIQKAPCEIQAFPYTILEMFCKQTVSAELWANFRKICGNCPFMEYFLTRKLCENTCILQGARFLLKKAFAFAKLRTRNIVFETLTSSTTLLLTKNWLDKVIIKKPYNKYIGLPTKILFLQQKITF